MPRKAPETPQRFVSRSNLIDEAFEPIYVLTPEQYNRIVNNLFNLLVGLISRLEDTSNPVASHQIAEHARDIFAGYDDDLADILARYLIASSRTDDAPSPALKGDDICID